MFNTLKNFLTRNSHSNNPESEEDYELDLQALSNPNFVTDRYKIEKLLIDIENSSPLCRIEIPDSNQEFNSSILETRAQQRQIVLDELTPSHGNNLLQRKQSLKLSTYLNGIHISFALTNLQPGVANGIIYYLADFPRRVYYPQRRKTPRVEVKTIHLGFNGTAAKNKASIGGYVFDISRGGIGIRLTNNRARVQRGDIIQNCYINLDNYRFEFDLVIRLVKQPHPNKPEIIIGGYFENVSARSENKLAYFVTSLEREEIRKQKA